MTTLTHLRAPGWDKVPGLTHGFLGRLGASPSKSTASGPGSPTPGCDESGALCDVEKAVGLEGRLITCPEQVHGDAILDVPVPVPKNAGEGDALVTDQPGVLLGRRGGISELRAGGREPLWFERGRPPPAH